ncbi:MAG: hypothetical protein ACLQUY_05820 [Ktedonobacterales bacterium]
MTRIRAASHTVACIDEYCAQYRSVFHNVRHFEQFTQLELGMLADDLHPEIGSGILRHTVRLIIPEQRQSAPAGSRRNAVIVSAFDLTTIVTTTPMDTSRPQQTQTLMTPGFRRQA